METSGQSDHDLGLASPQLPALHCESPIKWNWEKQVSSLRWGECAGWRGHHLTRCSGLQLWAVLQTATRVSAAVSTRLSPDIPHH
jgi:hypothetical protein